jgi:hypothetical protein
MMVKGIVQFEEIDLVWGDPGLAVGFLAGLFGARAHQRVFASVDGNGVGGRGRGSQRAPPGTRYWNAGCLPGPGWTAAAPVAHGRASMTLMGEATAEPSGRHGSSMGL